MHQARRSVESPPPTATETTSPNPSWTPAPSLEEVRAGGAVLRRQHSGDSVSQLQGLLGVAASGLFGSDTENAVEAFQEARKLRPPPGMEGMVGRTTLQHLEQRGSSAADAEPLAVWTTGASSSLLPQDGSWTPADFRDHHTDRTRSAAADRVRANGNTPYQAVEAFDFTFETLDSRGRAMEGSAHGLELRVPVRSKVADIEPTFHNSGGYGKFILLEYLEGDQAGQRVEIHHLDSVEPFSIGQEVEAGSVFGTQGASGLGRYSFATHIDIVGTADAVSVFVRANQSGEFRTRTRAPEPEKPKAEATDPGTPSAAPSLDDVRAGKATLRQGHQGDAVAHVQRRLGVGADGDFGPLTHRAVVAFQEARKLRPPPGMEGMVGQTTLKHLEDSSVATGPEGAYGIAPLALSSTTDVDAYPAEMRAFLRAITYAEGTPDAAGYHREVGNTMYPSTQNVHPGAANTQRYRQTGFNSDAYGRYQFLSDTWAEWAKAADIPTVRPGKNAYGEAYYDISPRHQDVAALQFLVRRGVQELLLAGRVTAAVSAVRSTWASLPGGPQPNDRTASFYDVYARMLQEERAADRQRRPS